MVTRPHPLHVKSGKIAAKVLQEVSKEVKPGVNVIKICTLAEKKIIEYGGKLAFPACVSINQIAAHYTSPIDDRITIPDFGLVKLDIGAHIDGYIADTAQTIDIDGTLEGMVAATDDALNEAISLMKPGVSLTDIGKQIERIIQSYGLRPIKEIYGHSLERYQLHAGKQVPNWKKHDVGKIEIGEYYAVETYATSGTGVVDSNNVFIFSNVRNDIPVDGIAEKLRLHLRKKYRSLPFALRWIGTDKKTKENIDIIVEFRKLLKVNAVKGSPVLVEKKGRPVSQSEHTVFISEEDAISLTGRN